MSKKTPSTSPVPLGTVLDSTLPDSLKESAAQSAARSIEERKALIIAMVNRNIEKELAPHEKRLAPLVASAQKIVVNDADGEAKCADIAKSITECLQSVEAFRDGSVRSFNDFVGAVNVRCKSIKEIGESAKQVMRDKILASRKAEEERIRKLNLEQAKKAAAKGKPAPAPVTGGGSNAVAGTAGKVAGAKTWVGEVVDEKKLPDMYWMINQKAIDGAVKAGIREIPGVKIYQKDQVKFS